MKRDAIVLSTWSWDTFNVPERISLALASQGARVLYCEMPVSRFRQSTQPLREIAKGVHRFAPAYLGAKLSAFPMAGAAQWRWVAKRILARACDLKLNAPVFLYSHIQKIAPLCREIRSAGLPLVHICMDYPEDYQHELIELSDQTVVIPKSVFTELRSKYGEKIQWIPQSIHLPAAAKSTPGHANVPPQLADLPRPRLGYLGPIFARLNLPLLRELLANNPAWHFFYFGDSKELDLPNAHSVPWRRPEELPAFLDFFDVGLMPYDCTDRKNLHCSPLKILDYFLAGLPVVSTPILAAAEFGELVDCGATARELSDAVVRALNEPPDSPKRLLRKKVAREHSTEAQGRRLAEVFRLLGAHKGQVQ